MSKDNSEVLAKLDQLTTLFVNEFNGLKTDISGLKADVSGLKADVSGLKAGQARLEEEMRKVKEVVGVTRMQEIARLDGRIDQLTLEVMQIRNAAE
ncbi:hypothetical protein D3093_33430 (plasmid) [Azospirillum argentinense]|uniref:Uncharacterized protein n=1 Tax=Azospirillum argentinense TaxID=2970906 RepID=A0A4D8PTN7_9PROT|nr:hypothetical protein [Azospirillum argentinense]QCO00158.1 hypothetical protein D3093_33430 [Azospirillum argentinense]